MANEHARPQADADARARRHLRAEPPARLLSDAQVQATAAAIEACQQDDGLILWFEGGHGDPWNHVEAAMALASAGHLRAAEHAYEWLRANQHGAGSWHNYYTALGPKDPKVDTNCCAYIAVGVWHHWLTSKDRGFAETMWPTVARALDFVTGLRTASGHIPWAVHADGTPWPYALLSASSSICHALRCGLALADLMGRRRRAWARALARTARQIRYRPAGFEPKDRWAMDWYYPVLCGVVTGSAARARLVAGAPKFLMHDSKAAAADGAAALAAGEPVAAQWGTPSRKANLGRELACKSQSALYGVRCVADQPWVTTAETCECALAYLRVGDAAAARSLIGAAESLRAPDGSYFTGQVMPQGKTFPGGERSSYSAAAVLLATDAFDRRSSAADALISAPGPGPRLR